MNKLEVAIPELAFIAGTRGLLGAGIGLVIGELFARETRRTIGWTLVAVGVLTTIPIAVEVLRRRRRALAGDTGD